MSTRLLFQGALVQVTHSDTLLLITKPAVSCYAETLMTLLWQQGVSSDWQLVSFLCDWQVSQLTSTPKPPPDPGRSRPRLLVSSPITQRRSAYPTPPLSRWFANQCCPSKKICCYCHVLYLEFFIIDFWVPEVLEDALWEIGCLKAVKKPFKKSLSMFHPVLQNLKVHLSDSLPWSS